jgi:hypothetical protein
LYFIKDIYNNFNEKDPGYNEIKGIIVQSEKDYRKLFSNKESKLKGEATASYLYYYKEAIPNIKNLLGKDVKIIIVLRNPIAKIISHYKFYLGKGFEKNSFPKALSLEEDRIAKGFNPFFHYKNQGFYYEAVKAYIEAFTNVHICFNEELKSNPQKFLAEIFSFLGVKNYDIKSKNVVFNKSYVPRSVLAHKIYNFINVHFAFIRQLIPFVNWKKIKKHIRNINSNNSFKINPNEINELKNIYLDDVLKLKSLINKELPKSWEL